ncbi:MAG: Fe(3+) dicitrate transport system permease protein FecC [Candidatus Celerinatantimonas neptuna]|nr:MAG: Fe(3+) dicitrate transport system permease protein FecC [Candidatus Celerinatantimonas neptuna]
MNNHYFAICLGLCSLIILAGILSLTQFSPLSLNIQEAWHVISGQNIQNTVELVIRELRIPRFIAAILIGAALASAGTCMQAITGNPLASPSLFGITAGASLGLVLATILPIWPGWLYDQLISMITAACCWGIIMFLTHTGRQNNSLKLILCGLTVTAFCSAITRVLLLFFESSSHSLLNQLTGNLAGLRAHDVFWLMKIIVPILIILLLISHRLDLLQLGREQAQNLGISFNYWQISLSLLVLVLVSTTVSLCGQFAFVGLLVPHLARFLTGHRHRFMLPVSMLIGANLVSWGDLLGRATNFPAETPAGAVLAIIGAPCLIYLVRRA